MMVPRPPQSALPRLVAVLLFLLLLLEVVPLITLQASAEVGSDEMNSGPGRFNSIKVKDIDGDGNQEIVFGDYDGYINVIEYNGGDFTMEWKMNLGSNRVWGVEVGDVNGDKKTEIVVGVGMGKVYVFSGKEHKELWTAQIKGRDAHGLALYDFDGDKASEIVVGTAFKNDDPNGQVLVFKFGVEDPIFESKKFNSRWRGVDVGDVDGDGTPEIVVGCGAALGDVAGTGYFRIFNISDDPDGLPEWTSPDLGGCVEGMVVKDVDSDGILNIVCSNGYRYNDGYLYIYQYDKASKDYKQQFKSENIGPKAYGLAVDDIDLDKTQEIVVGNQPGYVYIFDGMRHTIEWKSQLLGTDVLGITTANLDDDPQLEIIAAQGGYQGKGDFTSGYTQPHIYIIDGKTHRIEKTVGVRDNVRFGLQVGLLAVVVVFLIEVGVLTKLLKRRKA